MGQSPWLTGGGARTKDLITPIKINHHLYLLQISSPCSGNSPSHHIPEEEKKEEEETRGKVLLRIASVYLWLPEMCRRTGDVTRAIRRDGVNRDRRSSSCVRAGLGCWDRGSCSHQTIPHAAEVGSAGSHECRPRPPGTCSRGDGSVGRRAAPARAAPAASQTPEPPRAPGSRIVPQSERSREKVFRNHRVRAVYFKKMVSRSFCCLLKMVIFLAVIFSSFEIYVNPTEKLQLPASGVAAAERKCRKAALGNTSAESVTRFHPRTKQTQCLHRSTCHHPSRKSGFEQQQHKNQVEG